MKKLYTPPTWLKISKPTNPNKQTSKNNNLIIPSVSKIVKQLVGDAILLGRNVNWYTDFGNSIFHYV